MASADGHAVLVIHGVTHRTPADFDDEVAALTEHLAPRSVHPVFWGDLGPGDVHDAYPVAAAATQLEKDTSVALAPAPVIADGPPSGWRRLVAAVSPDALVNHMRHAIARTVRDVEAYERNGTAIRARLDDAYRAVCDDVVRVDVIAHSLGALIASEWLFGAPAGEGATDASTRRIDTFVTLGSQVALFCEVRGLQGANAFVAPPPVPVPITLPLLRWANVWHELDPLAFAAAPVLDVTGRDGPVAIDEYHLDVGRVPTTASFHSAYWRDERILAWLPRIL